ncbi:MAG: MFS family permease [Acidimicrobiales bacterium]|jgi:MFS family permease
MALARTQVDDLPFNGWRIVRSGFTIQALHSGLVFNAFALIAVELRDEFGWSASALGAAFALNRAESGLLGPLQGWMTDSWGPRTVLRIGAVIMAIGLVAFATVDSLVEFYIFYLLVSLGSSLAGFLGITVSIVNWFERKRARALALAQMGFAVGGAFTFLVGIALQQFGWRTTSVLSAGLTLAVILPLSRHFDKRPEDIGQFIDGIDPETIDHDEAPMPTTVSRVHFTASEALRTRAFWFISLGHASALLVVGASMAHLGLYLEEERGFSTLHTAFVVGMLPAMMGVGQMLGGILGDRFDKRLMVTIAMLGHGLGMLLLALASSWLFVWLFVLFNGLAWGVRGPIQSAMRADYFGATSFGKIMGFSSMIVMTGMVIGPVLAGVLRDRTGDYRLGFIILAAVAALGSVWFLLSTPPAPPKRSQLAGD